MGILPNAIKDEAHRNAAMEAAETERKKETNKRDPGAGPNSPKKD